MFGKRDDKDLPLDANNRNLDRDMPLDAAERDRMSAGEVGRVREEEARLTLSEEELAVGKRQVAAGEVGIRKHVETEHVRESIPTMREEVTVERRPITGDAMHAEGRIQEEEIRVPLHAEEVVAEKRVVPKEELVVRKHEVQEERIVEADLRREHAHVDEVDTTRTRERTDVNDRDRML